MTTRDANVIAATVSRALALHQAGRLPEAESLYRSVLESDRNQFEALHFLGLIEAQRQNYEAADRLMSRSLEINARTADAYANHARVLNALKRSEPALAACDKALAINPRLLGALISRGIALQYLGRHDEALKTYDKCLELKRDYVAAMANRGGALLALRRYAEALASYDQAVAIAPNDTAALRGRGRALGLMNRIEEALTACDRALALKPDDALALMYRGIALNLLLRPAEGLAALDRALAIESMQVETLFHRGNSLYALHRLPEALQAYEAAVALKPDYVDAISNRGDALAKLGQLDGALASYDRALAIDPRHASAWKNKGNVLNQLRRFGEAADAYEQALEVEPAVDLALGSMILARLQVCEWDSLDEQCIKLRSAIGAGQCASIPWVMYSVSDSAAEQFECTKTFVQKFSPVVRPMCDPSLGRSGKLKVAYVSPDYRTHPTSLSFVDVLERHDRGRFETIGISLGPDDGSEARARIVRAFDQFHDVVDKSDAEIAVLIRDLKVHIAIELAPHTDGSRAGILAHRPAPIQVNHLSPFTSGGTYLDYVIGDPYVLPFDQQPYYSENIVHLPGCCFQRDCTQAIADRTPTRADAGLPEGAFVFCAFNNAYKINRRMFDVWMRILKSVEGSVLWLAQLNAEAFGNLRGEATERGIDDERLILAPRKPAMAEHLARYRLADLFLDTLPYNAQTTASDALWAGLPVLTCWGRTYVGRLAGSQLQAIGLGELATVSLKEYEALALRLARDRDRLRALRQQLADNRATSPLFDSARLCRHTEAAYTTMWEIHERGEAPRSFAVDPVDARS